MYLGRVVEQGRTEDVFRPPYHPYTEALLAAAPGGADRDRRRSTLEGTVPAAAVPAVGCPFQSRCPRKIGAICETEPPPTIMPAEGHEIACHISLYDLAAVPPVFPPASA